MGIDDGRYYISFAYDQTDRGVADLLTLAFDHHEKGVLATVFRVKWAQIILLMSRLGSQ